jgi:hypothetical protein
VGRIAYTSTSAAKATSAKEVDIEAAVRARILPAHEVGNRIVILHDDLVTWIKSKPTLR